MPKTVEDEAFKKFLYSCYHHSSKESGKVINFLMERQTPLLIDLGYEAYIEKNSMNQGDHPEIIIKSRLKRDFRSIFVLHGALDLDIPILTPL
jgi:hypothetical protein